MTSRLRVATAAAGAAIVLTAAVGAPALAAAPRAVGCISPVGAGNGFLRSGNQVQIIRAPAAGAETSPFDVNNSGDVVGGYTTGGQATHGFLFSGGMYRTIDVRDPATGAVFDTVLRSINEGGEMLGNYEDAGGQCRSFRLDSPAAAPTPVVVLDGTPLPGGGTLTNGTTVAGGLSDNGAIAGTVLDSSGGHGFLLTGDDVMTFDHPSGPGATLASAVNNAGQTAGYYPVSAGRASSYVRDDPTFTTVYYPPPATTVSTVALGINNNATVVGYYENTARHGFRYSRGAYTAIDITTAQCGTPVTVTQAHGINDSDQIVGYCGT